MATKGASNWYGNARGGRQGHPTQHTGFAWAKAFNRSTLDDHFQRHGEQMGCPTKESYNANAVKFANTVDRKNNVSFVARNGTTYKFNKMDGTFAIISKRGVVITYFKPKDGYDYYKAQIERARK
ncbi:MAG: hypothetical protein II583_05710 [Oscillospiraceae bacterium]|nr:hypothetical protein [Oscillospiraceae bacterium]